MKKSLVVQAFKYGIVGILNTLLTAFIIWFMMKFVFGIVKDDEASSMVVSISNFTGYIVGLINSFVFNRNWTFQSKESWKIGFLKFLLGFGICYLIQLGVVLLLNAYADIQPISFSIIFLEPASYHLSSAYICQLIGIVCYTILNFLFNKFYTFKR